MSELSASSLASLSPRRLEGFLSKLSPGELELLESDWRFWARPKQLPPPPGWLVWLIMAGRGWGKTWVGASVLNEKVRSGAWKRPAIIGPTAGDVRAIMVTGEAGGSGILPLSPRGFRPQFNPSKRTLTYPNGVIARLYSAEEPERLRGPQHDSAWCDELRAWKYPQDTWDNLEFGLREVGSSAEVVVTTTPRPFPLLKRLLADPRTVLTRGSTFENEANLSPDFLERMKERYAGTRLGRQELEAELLEDVEGALWVPKQIENTRFKGLPDLSRVIVAVDPAVTSGEASAETGIVAAGKGRDGHYYVLADDSLRASPRAWGSAVVKSFRTWKADRVVGEVNNGGDLIESVLRSIDEELPYKDVRATRGKHTRAEPIAALYEQGKVHHCGVFPKLEEQMCSWVPDGKSASPDRMDALVWALTFLSDSEGVRLRFI